MMTIKMSVFVSNNLFWFETFKVLLAAFRTYINMYELYTLIKLTRCRLHLF